MIYLQLFIAFCWVGVFCVGGGYASVPLIQQQVIDIHHWMTIQEFMDIFAISQMTPGPIGVNAATFVGARVAGLGGSIAATLGFVTPSMIIMYILARIVAKYGNVGAVKGILNGLRPAVVALIGGAALLFIYMAVFGVSKFTLEVSSVKYLNVVIIAICYVIVKKKWLGVIHTLLLSGVLGIGLNLLAGNI